MQTPAQTPQPLDPAVKRDGWWIRVGKEITAEKVTWRFYDPSKKAPGATITWQRANDPDNFDLPEGVRTLAAVGFEVTVEPAGSPMAFCVFHQAEGAQLVELTRTRNLTIESRARDKRCRP